MILFYNVFSAFGVGNNSIHVFKDSLFRDNTSTLTITTIGYCKYICLNTLMKHLEQVHTETNVTCIFVEEDYGWAWFVMFY